MRRQLDRFRVVFLSLVKLAEEMMALGAQIYGEGEFPFRERRIWPASVDELLRLFESLLNRSGDVLRQAM